MSDEQRMDCVHPRLHELALTDAAVYHAISGYASGFYSYEAMLEMLAIRQSEEVARLFKENIRLRELQTPTVFYGEINV